MKPRPSDDESSMDSRDGALTPKSTSWVRSGDDVEAAHDRCEVDLTVAERCCFDEIVAPMWTLRVTRGHRSAVFERARTYVFFGIVGMSVSVAALGWLPLAVSFAGFVVAVAAFSGLCLHVAGSTWGRWTGRSWGLLATAGGVVVAWIAASALLVRSAKRST